MECIFTAKIAPNIVKFKRSLTKCLKLTNIQSCSNMRWWTVTYTVLRAGSTLTKTDHICLSQLANVFLAVRFRSKKTRTRFRFMKYSYQNLKLSILLHPVLSISKEVPQASCQAVQSCHRRNCFPTIQQRLYCPRLSAIFLRLQSRRQQPLEY